MPQTVDQLFSKSERAEMADLFVRGELPFEEDQEPAIAEIVVGGLLALLQHTVK